MLTLRAPLGQLLRKGELLSVCTSGGTALVDQQVIDGGVMQTRRTAPPEGPNATEMALMVGQQGETSCLLTCPGGGNG